LIILTNMIPRWRTGGCRVNGTGTLPGYSKLFIHSLLHGIKVKTTVLSFFINHRLEMWSDKRTECMNCCYDIDYIHVIVSYVLFSWV
jgi:hypothetical protein